MVITTDVKTDNRGFTLIELLVALVIIMIVMLGISTMLTLSMQENISSLLREEAVKVADEVLNGIRSLPFDDITPDGTWNDNDFMNALGYSPADPDPDALNPPLDRAFRKFIIHYTPQVTVNTTDDLKEVTVAVTWQFKGVQKRHTISTIIRKRETE